MNIGELPQDYCIIYDFAFEYKMHINGIVTSTYIEITQSKFNKIKWNHKIQGRQQKLKQIYFLARDKAIKSNSQCKDDQYTCTT
jgi:hypothetical protein